MGEESHCVPDKKTSLTSGLLQDHGQIEKWLRGFHTTPQVKHVIPPCSSFQKRSVWCKLAKNILRFTADFYVASLPPEKSGQTTILLPNQVD